MPEPPWMGLNLQFLPATRSMISPMRLILCWSLQARRVWKQSPLPGLTTELQNRVLEGLLDLGSVLPADSIEDQFKMADPPWKPPGTGAMPEPPTQSKEGLMATEAWSRSSPIGWSFIEASRQGGREDKSSLSGLTTDSQGVRGKPDPWTNHHIAQGLAQINVTSWGQQDLLQKTTLELVPWTNQLPQQPGQKPRTLPVFDGVAHLN